MEGYIKLHREMMDHPVYQDFNSWRLYCHLLMKAAHKDTVYNTFTGDILNVEKGSLITGRIKLSEETGLSEQNIRTCLSKLEGFFLIKLLTTDFPNPYTKITICNYEAFSGGVRSVTKASNHVSTGNKEKIIINNNLNMPSKSSPYSDDFEKLWKLDRKKQDKAVSYAAFQKRILEGYTLEDMILGVERYHEENKGNNPKYTKGLSVLLNYASSSVKIPKFIEYRDKVLEERKRSEAFEEERKKRHEEIERQKKLNELNSPKPATILSFEELKTLIKTKKEGEDEETNL